MMDHDFPLTGPTQNLGFDEFWEWMRGHYNCVLRAGTQDVALFDDELLHWRFSRYDADSWLIQVARGKMTVAEMALFPSRVSYVQVTEIGPEEFLYELIYDENGVAEVMYFFALTHDVESDEPERRQWMN